MRSINKLWEKAKGKLTSDKLNDGEFHLVRIDESSIVPSYCGIDNSSRLIIGFKTSTRPNIPLIETVAFESIISPRPDKSWLYVIRLLDNNLIEVFESLCIDFISEVLSTHDEKDFSELLRQRVHSWQKLFTTTTNGLLNKNQIVGLIGELSVLIDLIDSNYLSLAQAIFSWRGPYGAPQDIIIDTESIEIKTVRKDSSDIEISSLKQLDGENLSLVVIEYLNANYGDINAVNLNDIVGKIYDKCKNEKLFTRKFNSGLIEAGYSYNNFYNDTNIKITNRSHYQVCSEFPKIVSGNISDGIVESRYKISRLSINHFLTKNYPYGIY
jgi:hypothetical protein